MSGDYSDIWDEKTRVARKQHWCVSGCRIDKGETYVWISSLYDGSWQSWNVHPRFQDWLNKVNESAGEDSRVSYWNFLECDLTYKELADLRNIMMETNAKMVTRMDVSHEMDLMWKDMQHQKEIDRLLGVIAEMEKERATNGR